MTSGMPELGSKISLISKADIRYEGRLFTVDPQECTIALSNVRSFGTEDRESQFAVAPQNQVYEYILFRGSDIKDIRVVNNVPSVPNDPAIVQMTVPLSNPGYQPTPGYGQPMMPQGPMGPMGPMGGQYGGPYGMPMNVPGMNPTMGMPPRDPRYVNKPPSELSAVPGEPNNTNIPNTLPMANVKPLTKAVDQVMEEDVLEMLAVAGASGGASVSRAGTPMLSSSARKSPTLELVSQGNQQQQPQQQQQQNARGKAVEKPGRRTPVAHESYRDKRDGQRGRSGSALSQYSDTKRDHSNQDHHPDNQGHRGGNMHNTSAGQRGNSRSANWITRGNNNLLQRGRGRGRGNVFRTNQPGNNGTKSKNTLKFENDYDFEQANTEFEELRSRLAKTKIDVGTENEKKDDSGNETGAGEGEPEEDADVIHYDKSKSFFDNISCEAVERSKGSQRTDWRTERKLNSETFGVSSTRRGGFRGRGGYYNRGMGMYRGNNQGNHQGQMGNNGGYRGGNYHRGGNRGVGNNGGNGTNMNRNNKPMHHGQNNAGQNRNGGHEQQNVSQQNRRLITGAV